jgi:hypothetical protein
LYWLIWVEIAILQAFLWFVEAICRLFRDRFPWS